MDKRYISEAEFKSYMDMLISLLEQGSSKEEVLAYLNGLIDSQKSRHSNGNEYGQGSYSDPEKRQTMLLQIKSILNNYGFNGEIRNDRKAGPYINIGDVSRVRLRVQFWYDERKDLINLWVGKEMGFWYSLSIDSKFRQPWEGMSDKENKLTFPNLESAVKYIEKVAEKSGKQV